MKKTITVLVIVTMAAALAFLLGEATKAVRAQIASQVPSYTIQYSGIDRGENPAKQYTYTVAMKSNGDSVITGQGQSQVTFRSIGTMVVMSTVNPEYKTTSGNGHPMVETVYPANCSSLTGLTGESKDMLGTKVLHLVKSASRITPDGGKLVEVEDAWLAPSFNCKALYDHQTWTYNGQPDGDKEETATVAIQGEPSPVLFEIHGVEASPDTFYASIGYPKVATPKKIQKYQADKASRTALGLN